MSTQMLSQWPCSIRSTEGNNTLTDYQNNVVVSMEATTSWRLITHEDYNDDTPPQFMIALNEDQNSNTRRIITMDRSNKNNIAFETYKIGDQPKPTQLWTMEKSITLMRFPPIVIGQIQSVASPDLCIAIGGDMPLPKIYLNVSALPETSGQRWTLDFTLTD